MGGLEQLDLASRVASHSLTPQHLASGVLGSQHLSLKELGSQHRACLRDGALPPRSTTSDDMGSH